MLLITLSDGDVRRGQTPWINKGGGKVGKMGLSKSIACGLITEIINPMRYEL